MTEVGVHAAAKTSSMCWPVSIDSAELRIRLYCEDVRRFYVYLVTFTNYDAEQYFKALSLDIDISCFSPTRWRPPISMSFLTTQRDISTKCSYSYWGTRIRWFVPYHLAFSRSDIDSPFESWVWVQLVDVLCSDLHSEHMKKVVSVAWKDRTKPLHDYFFSFSVSWVWYVQRLYKQDAHSLINAIVTAMVCSSCFWSFSIHILKCSGMHSRASSYMSMSWQKIGIVYAHIRRRRWGLGFSSKTPRRRPQKTYFPAPSIIFESHSNTSTGIQSKYRI